MFARPNWRDAAQYSKFLEVYPDLMAWEFMRRNADYQAEYLKVCEVEIVLVVHHLNVATARRSPSPESALIGASGEARVEDARALYRRFCSRWRLRKAKDPAENYYHYDFSEAPIFEWEDLCNFTHFEEWQPSSGPRVMIPVDLSMPLEAIEESVMGIVRSLRLAGVEHGSIKPIYARTLSAKVYVEHLRILDGVEAGATIAEIGEALRPGAINDPEEKQRDKRTRAAHKAALKMQADGWRVLAGVPD
jgi:hypothetical protein